VSFPLEPPNDNPQV